MEQISPKQKAARKRHSQELVIQLDARVNMQVGEKGKKKTVSNLLLWRSNKFKGHQLAATNVLMGEAEGRKVGEKWSKNPLISPKDMQN